MQIDQVRELIRYSEEVGVPNVTPIEEMGIIGVRIGKLTTFSFERAHAELTSLGAMTVPVVQVAA